LTFLGKISLNYNQYSAIADLDIFQFTVVHALGFSVSPGNGSQHRNYHFKSLRSLLVISSTIALEYRPNSPILILQSPWFWTLYCAVQIRTQLISASLLCYPFKLASLYRRRTNLQKTRVTCRNAWRGPHRRHSHTVAWRSLHRKHSFLYCCVTSPRTRERV
jgi:hypothetical protein